MPKTSDIIPRELWVKAAAGAAAIILTLAAYLILSPFLVSITWSIVLASVTWPVYRRVRRLFKHDTTAAAAMLLAVVTLIILPFLLITVAAWDEAAAFYAWFKPIISGGASAVEASPNFLKGIEWLQSVIPFGMVDVKKAAYDWTGKLFEAAALTGEKTVKNLFKAVITVFFLFFLYRDGEGFLSFVHRALPVDKDYGERMLSTVRDVVKAVVYGIIITAMVQGLLAGIGFWVLGFDSAIIMGVGTGIFALVPFGSSFVWIPASIWLFLTGSYGKAIALALWGAGVVGTIDNVIRPMVISTHGKTSGLLAFVGILGGLMAFGMIGLFIGPVVLAVSLALVKEYVRIKSEKEDAA